MIIDKYNTPLFYYFHYTHYCFSYVILVPDSLRTILAIR